MLKLIVFAALVACGFSISGFGEKPLGPGKWFVINIMKCEEDDEMVLKLEVNRHKINRTIDGFNGKITIDFDIDGSFGVYVDICKFVDGGCKPYQIITDESFERFCKKWSKNNTERILQMAGIEPPDFPIRVGTYEITNYLMDYNDLPPNGYYGTFIIKAYLTKDGVKKACVKLHSQFTEKNEEDD